jgi:methionyl aminopeptidase
MIAIKTEREIAILREANQIVAEVLVMLAGMVKPGVRTVEMDDKADALIRERGGIPAFLGYHGFPKSTCISVDEVIVHGIPGDRILKEGELVSMDCGVVYKGFVGDAAITVPCGAVNAQRKKLMDTTDLALARAVRAAKEGNYLEAIGRAVQETCESAGFSVVREFVGHGIGQKMHEEPQIPNFVTGR